MTQPIDEVTTPNSFDGINKPSENKSKLGATNNIVTHSLDAELDKVLSRLKSISIGNAGLITSDIEWAKQAILTHRNAELEGLLEQQIKVTDDIGPHRVVSAKLIEDLIKEETNGE